MSDLTKKMKDHEYKQQHILKSIDHFFQNDLSTFLSAMEIWGLKCSVYLIKKGFSFENLFISKCVRKALCITYHSTTTPFQIVAPLLDIIIRIDEITGNDYTEFQTDDANY